MAFVQEEVADEAAARMHGALPAGAVAKLPYAGLNRIRFEGSVSTVDQDVPRYPRFRPY
jgi:hypothetical protein